jgi:hypothetical protein
VFPLQMGLEDSVPAMCSHGVLCPAGSLAPGVDRGSLGWRSHVVGGVSGLGPAFLCHCPSGKRGGVGWLLGAKGFTLCRMQ